MSNISEIKGFDQNNFKLFETAKENLDLAKVAEEFESLFVSQMLKQANKSMSENNTCKHKNKNIFRRLSKQSCLKQNCHDDYRCLICAV